MTGPLKTSLPEGESPKDARLIEDIRLLGQLLGTTIREQEGDAVFESDDVKVVIDAKSLVYIDGTELDYTKEGLNEGFQFNNPNVSAECGCGESFHV